MRFSQSAFSSARSASCRQRALRFTSFASTTPLFTSRSMQYARLTRLFPLSLTRVQDFGPLNLGCLYAVHAALRRFQHKRAPNVLRRYRYCQILKEKLSNELHKDKKLIHYCNRLYLCFCCVAPSNCFALHSHFVQRRPAPHKQHISPRRLSRHGDGLSPSALFHGIRPIAHRLVARASLPRTRSSLSRPHPLPRCRTETPVTVSARTL